MADDIFTQAPDEVTRYFDAKGQQPSLDWTDFAPHEHALSFTVAQSAGYDVLDDIRASVKDAATNYGSYGEFVDDLEPILRKKGWWGRVTRQDGKEVQLGSLRRLRTIYWANTKTARAAGEWERIQRTKRGIPFLIYELSSAEKRRPEHEGWVGIILKVDDTWWRTHYPPNGWLCQCRVRQITRFEAEALGYDPETPAPQIVTQPWTNKTTGETIQVPRGIDPGWQTHPGIARAQNLRRHLSERLDGMSAVARDVAIRDLVGSAKFKAVQKNLFGHNRNQPKDPNRQITAPVAILDDDRAALMRVRTRTVNLSVGDAAKQIDVHPEVTLAEYELVQDFLRTGALYEDRTSDHEFIFQKLVKGQPWAVVLHITKDRREMFLKSYHRIRANQFGETKRTILMDAPREIAEGS